MRRGGGKQPTPQADQRLWIVFSSPHVGKEAGVMAPRPYNGFSKQGQGNEPRPMKGTR